MSGRGEGLDSAEAGSGLRLAASVRRRLPADTARAWEALAGRLPEALYLGGGTALAVCLGHRESRDLDFFFHDDSVDLTELESTFTRLGEFAATFQDEATLRGLFGQTKIEAFNASKLKLLREPRPIGGLPVASLEDLMAMKLKVLAERGEMRDYFDVMTIELETPLTVEQGIELYRRRYRVEAIHPNALAQLVRSMGYLGDVEEDEALPISLDELEAWWRKRQAQVIRNSSWFS